MKIILSAIEPELVTAWERFCGDLAFVEIYHGSVIQLSCDAVVSPANSFGFMDGGVDMLYSQHFGWQVEERLQKLIVSKHHGELLVGTAEIVATDSLQIPYLIAAPTMRVPMILKNSVNPYLATRAVLLLAKHGIFADGPLKDEPVANFVDSIAFTGMGTGVGRIAPDTCARQVRAAIEEVIMGKNEFPQSWADAQKRHQQLFTEQIHDLQYDLGQ